MNSSVKYKVLISEARQMTLKSTKDTLSINYKENSKNKSLKTNLHFYYFHN